MFAGSLLVGFTVLVVAVWLEYSDSVTSAYWANHAARQRGNQSDAASSSDNRYRRIRRRWRLVIHALLALCGVLMISAGWAGPGRFWIAAWTAVAMLMLCILILALGDALRTHTHHSRKLAESRSTLKEKMSGK